MQIYTIHLKPDSLSPDRDALAVKEGFCWPAFIFGPFWALWHGLWLVLFGIIMALAALSVFEELLRPDPLSALAVSLGVAAILGLCGNDWRRASLALRGWRFEALSAAADRDTAMRRFFDLHPDALPGGISHAAPHTATHATGF